MSTIQSIQPETLHDWLEKGEAVLIDVRESDEYITAHIPGAIHLPLGECRPERIPHNPTKKLVFQCKKGKRSHMACEGCTRAMPDTILYSLDGGIDAWMQAGFSVVSHRK